MCALTSYRKRGDNWFNLSSFSSPYNSQDSNFQSYLPVSKKPRIFMHLNPNPSVSLVSPQRKVSRIHQYPEPIQPIRREIHGPCRKPKFNLSVISGRGTHLDNMGNCLAHHTLEHSRKDKEVIDVDHKCSKDVISEDSSIEELQTLDNGHEGDGQSVVSNKRSVETNVEDFLKEKYEKFADYNFQRSLETNEDVYLKEKYEKFADYHLQGSSSVVSDLTNQTPKVDDVGKSLESLIVNHGLEEMGVLPHKKLYESAERRNAKLDSLDFNINLTKKKLSFFSRPAKNPEEDVLWELFVPLTDEEEAEVSCAFSNSNWRNVLVAHENSNIEITGQILQCLRPGAWLNDEVINVYLELLKEREKREPKKFLKCHFFSTFFYKKLISGKNGYDYKAVKRWTTQRKIGYGLIECDKIFVPIHKEIHWCLAVINKKEEKFQYLDSLKGMDTQVLKVLARYFVDEVKDKNAKDIDVSSWKQEYVDDLPEQENGWDCGMFMIKYADFYSRGVGLKFNQENMPYFRLRTAKEILRLKAE